MGIRLPSKPMKRNCQTNRAVWFFLLLVICFWGAGRANAALLNVPQPAELVWKGESDGSVTVSSPRLGVLKFQPQFTVLYSARDPKPELRWAELGERGMQNKYNVFTWLSGESESKERSDKPASDQHVADGFDLSTDRSAGSERTFDVFNSGKRVSLSARSASREGDRITWNYDPNPQFQLSAALQLPQPGEAPVLSFTLEPKVAGWFSVGYTGAPEEPLESVSEVWQPLIWQEKRFPNKPYLTEAARCTLPCTLVGKGGLVWGVVAASRELPFQPMPTPANSRFGVSVRNAKGLAQPTLFAPILGGSGSRRAAGEALTFETRLVALPGKITEAYEQIARTLYGFKNYRVNNGLGSLNNVLERTLDYAMSSWARFDEDLRGSAYETDVPGSVKNVSALHPLALALVTDNEDYFGHRAKPMIEYVLSREKFLFTTDPKVTGQGASPRMTGPCAPISELTALYEIGGRRSPMLLKMAEALYGRTRTLNLDDSVRGDLWQNALALYRATGKQEWLRRACQGADAYIEQRLETPQRNLSDNGSRGMFFWTSYAPNWMELYELYAAAGNNKYLEASREGARRFAQFVWMCPEIPEGSVTVNEGGLAPAYRKGARFPRIEIPEESVPAWRVSEIGLTCESSGTSKGHRGIFLATHAPWMLRLAGQTGDQFLHDIGRSAIVGRYTSFPGYHMNTARTTVYEKPDFAMRPTAQINSTSSLHYNHIWPQIAMLIDYLVSDANARSAGAVSFPSHFAEGYAYLQLQVYGDRPGKFYDDDGVWLWMPKGLLNFDNPEINYIAARRDDTLYLALMNQCANRITATCAVNARLAGFDAGKRYETRVWRQNQPGKPESLNPAKFKVEIAPSGITALALKGVSIIPKFQAGFETHGQAWKQDQVNLHFEGGAHAMVLNFGPQLTWAYVYLEAREQIKQATLKYSTGGAQKALTDAAFPFEFSVPLPADAKEFSFQIEATSPLGAKLRSNVERLAR